METEEDLVTSLRADSVLTLILNAASEQNETQFCVMGKFANRSLTFRGYHFLFTFRPPCRLAPETDSRGYSKNEIMYTQRILRGDT